MKNFDDILKEMRACSYAKEWAEGKDFETIWTTCHRGVWMGWLVDKLEIDKRLRVLVGGHCANTVRHLMTDERSTNVIDVCIRYGNGEATEEELRLASDAAWSAASAAAREAAAAWAVRSAMAASAVVSAASAAAWYASDAACAASAARAAIAAASYAGASWWDNQLQTADIIRKYITSEMMIEKLETL